MANFYGTGRSNYVEVKDEKKFEEFCDQWSSYFDVVTQEVDGKKHYALLSTSEDGDLPGWDEDDNDIEFMQLIAPHLKEDKDNIFVWMSAGNEKMRYVLGGASAINYKGEECYLCLEDIYNACVKELGHYPRTKAMY